MSKKTTILSAVLALSMVTANPFVNVYATRIQEGLQYIEENNKTAVSWSLDESTGVLTISGSGPMQDYDFLYLNGVSYAAPWYDFNTFSSPVKKVIIQKGVTSIGDKAFCNCMDIEEVVIEGDIVSIGESAFSSCRKLKKITLPDSVESIENSAFSDCTSLSMVTVSANLKYIAESAFSYCTSLTTFAAAADNPNYTCVDGVLFSKDKKILIQYPVGKTDAKYSIPYGTEEIGGTSFSGASKLTSVVIPDTVKTISYNAFSFCKNLENVTFPSTLPSLGQDVFNETKFLNSMPSTNGMKISNGILFKYSGTAQNITLPSSVKIIPAYAFYSDSSLTTITIPEKCTINSTAFYNCSALTNVTVKSGCTLESASFERCKSLKSIRFEGVPSLKGSICKECGSGVSIDYTRPKLSYTHTSNSNGFHNNVSSAKTKLSKGTVLNSSFVNSCITFNNGFESIDSLQEMTDSSGNLYAAVQTKEGVDIVSEKTGAELNFSLEGFSYGASAFDDMNNIYILWGHKVSDNDINSFIANSDENIVVCKYDKNGNYISKTGFTINDLKAQYPFTRGNAHLCWKDGVLLCFFHTEWTKALDGLHHQGSVSAGIKTDTMSKIMLNSNEGSHSFGSTIIPTEYGFAAIQMGDVYRGFNTATFGVENGRCSSSYVNDNGKNIIFHASGEYGSNEKHIDGNHTYLHMGGLAKSASTYAAAGKAERNYTTNTFYNSTLHNQVYDVFVRIVDQTLQNINTSDLAGVDRIDAADKSVDDKNVVWLTECNDTEKAGEVKVVTLEDGSYCILWEKYINEEFDSIRYVITDECGNIIRRETAVYGGRLSKTSIQPIVKNSTLEWAVCNENTNEITWYTLDLEALEEDDEWKSNVIKGDVDRNGVIDADDAKLATMIFEAGGKGYTREQIYAADVNGDGLVNANDASEIIRIYQTTSTSTTTGDNSEASQTTVTTTPTYIPPVTAEPGKTETGDINNDGKVDASDASQILKVYALLSTGGTPKETAKQMEAADVNKDGKVDASDASYVLGYYAYLSTITGNPVPIENFIS